MRYVKTELPGVYLIHLEKQEDERGFFARTWCTKEFNEKGISANFVQANLSFNKKAGTLRGMHYQIAPYQEAKYVRCIRGRIYDAVIDLRPDSPTYERWQGYTLTEEDFCGFFVPEGFAHGFLTLEDNSVVIYHVTCCYTPGAERGVRWNDPRFKITWPREVKIISAKDQSWPDYN